MYKHATRSPPWTRGGTSTPRKDGFNPRTDYETRRWWFPVIEQAVKTKTKLSRHTSRKAPKWLIEELEQAGWPEWLKAHAHLRNKAALPRRQKTREDQE